MSTIDVDNESPSGSWKEEMDRMPWRYGDSKIQDINSCLAQIRFRGLWAEANFLAQEMTALRAEISNLRETIERYENASR